MLSNILASMILTLPVYAAFPLIFAFLRKNPIKYSVYSTICYIVNFAIKIILLSLAVSSNYSMLPCLLWTYIFSKHCFKMIPATPSTPKSTEEVLPQSPTLTVVPIRSEQISPETPQAVHKTQQRTTSSMINWKALAIFFLALLPLVAFVFYNGGKATGYTEGYADGYLALDPVEMPRSGEVLTGSTYFHGAEMKITASPTQSVVVTLKNKRGVVRHRFFVRAGDTVTVGVPRETLYAYFASGETWYGLEKGLMFGEDTYYFKDDSPLDFENYSWSYNLSSISGGNFTEIASNEVEFFG